MKTMNRLAVAPASTEPRADRIWGLKITELLCWHPLKTTIWALLLLPAVVMSQEQARDDELQREWNEIQSSKGQYEKSNWWQRLDLEHLEKYLQVGADVKISDKRRWTPLHSAARYNSDSEVLAALLQAGAIVGARDKAGDTPLHWAAAQNTNVKIVTALIEAGANVNERDKFGWTPLHTAAESNSNPAVIEALLAAGAKRQKRAYFVLFRPRFLLKHNSKISETDKKIAMALLKEPG